jgi:hypothetical protein
MKQALLVGINEYPTSRLHSCVHDANELAKLLRINGDETLNFNVKVECNIKTKGHLRRMIRTLFRAVADEVVFYFSGHGYISNEGGYLLAPDCHEDDIGIPMDEILFMANESPVRSKVIILDCCYSGAFGSPQLAHSSAFIKNGITVLSSSRADEVSLEDGKHSVFTRSLLEALKGGAADIKGDITAASTYSFIEQSMGYWGQRPLFKSNVSHSTVLRKIVPRVEHTVLRSLSSLFHNPDSHYALNKSFEESNEEADSDNVKVFKNLKKLEQAGVVEPYGAPYMYHAAQNDKACQLTSLGKYYWQLAKDQLI